MRCTKAVLHASHSQDTPLANPHIQTNRLRIVVLEILQHQISVGANLCPNLLPSRTLPLANENLLPGLDRRGTNTHRNTLRLIVPSCHLGDRLFEIYEVEIAGASERVFAGCHFAVFREEKHQCALLAGVFVRDVEVVRGAYAGGQSTIESDAHGSGWLFVGYWYDEVGEFVGASEVHGTMGLQRSAGEWT